jgi:hypothetical protein
VVGAGIKVSMCVGILPVNLVDKGVIRERRNKDIQNGMDFSFWVSIVNWM